MSKRDELKELLKLKKSKAYYAKRLGISELEVGLILKQMQGKISPPNKNYKEKTFSEDIQAGTAELTDVISGGIETLEDLVTKCKIDETVWEITKYVQNYWGDGNYQVKAWLSKIKKAEAEKTFDFLSTFQSSYKPVDEQVINNILLNTTPVSVLVSLSDPHIDKKTLDGSTIEEKCEEYTRVLQTLLIKSANSHNIEEIVFVLGNDYFTSDTYHNTTTNLTPQGTTVDYDVAYEKGFELAVNSIALCKQFAQKVKVIYVPGNHDRTKSFYLVHALEVFFKPDVNITFDRTAENTKVHTYGANFLGLHHGDTKMENLPNYFSTKYRKQWGDAKYAEIALGDKHHKKQWSYKLSENEVAGTRMFIVPALTTPDKWHKDKTYDAAIIAGVVRVYNRDRGYCGEFEERT